MPLFAATTLAKPPSKTIETGRLRIEYRPRPGGMRLFVDGIEVIKSSELIITTPPWAPHHYVGPTEKVVTSANISKSDKRQMLSIVHQSENAFDGTEEIIVIGDSVVEHTLTGRFLQPDKKALIQWRMGAWNPSLFVGKSYHARCGEQNDTNGIVPVTPLDKESSGALFLGGLRDVRFDSRIGPVRIEVESDQPLTFQDYRTSRWANPNDPYFWFGDLSSTFDASKPISYRVRYIFESPPAPKSTAVSETAKVTVHKHADAQVGFDPQTIIVTPTPKQFELLKERSLIADSAYLKKSLDDGTTEPLARKAIDVLLSAWRDSQSAGHGRPAPSLGTKSPDRASIHFELIDADEELPPQGYHLTVESDVIEIRAGDESGFLHAVQTIKQLTGVDRHNRLVVAACRIKDWPSLPFRGVHLFTGGKGTALHEMLITQIIAALKMNRLVFEAEYVEWDSHPETHHPDYGMPKNEVRTLLNLCERLGVQVIPLVQSLGHCQWIFENGENLDIAEDPDAKWAYCVTNPATYDFIFDVFEEAVELFKPAVFHIGHDEYADRGRVPFRAESKKYTIEELFVKDTLKLHEWFKKRGIRVMMWGDMLLAKGEGPDACHAKSAESARTMRRNIPSDIMISDWHYADDDPQEFTNLNVFHRAGFETVASTWSRPGNIRNFARAAFESQSKGLLQTTWAGYSLDPESFHRELPQYLVYVLAAESAWNADHASNMDMLAAGQRFLDLSGMSILKPGWREGWTADLSPACNYSLKAQDQSGWFGLGPKHDLSLVPSGIVNLKGVRFQIGDPQSDSCIALRGKLSGKMALPSQVSLNIDAEAEELIFIVTTDFACAKGTRVATIRAESAAGPTDSLDLVYGKNTFAASDLSPAADAPVVWRGKTIAGKKIALRAIVWKLKKELGELGSITIHSANSAASPILIAMTGLTNNR